MESTGIYWQNLFSTLVDRVLVILVIGRQTKTSKEKRRTLKIASGFKTAFTKDFERQLSTRFRHGYHTDLFQTSAKPTQAIRILHQENAKYLRLMNMRLEVVVRDIVGLTGSSIIELF